MSRLTLIAAVALCLLAAALPAHAAAAVRTVEPGGKFKLAASRVVDEVRIKGGPKLRMRCIGDGCDWRRRGKAKVLASISDIDRVFRSSAKVKLRVTTRRA